MMKLNAMELQGEIKEALGEWLPKEANKAVYAFCQKLATKVNRAMREKQKQMEEEAKAISEHSIDSKIKTYMENPLSKEEEAKLLRATLHSELASGSLSPQLLDKLDRIIGIATDEDETTEMVDFSEAFPDLATAIEICSQPQPRLCKCGGVISESTSS